MEYITKINKRTGPNHYYTVVPNKSAQGGFFFSKKISAHVLVLGTLEYVSNIASVKIICSVRYILGWAIFSIEVPWVWNFKDFRGQPQTCPLKFFSVLRSKDYQGPHLAAFMLPSASSCIF